MNWRSKDVARTPQQRPDLGNWHPVSGMGTDLKEKLLNLASPPPKIRFKYFRNIRFFLAET